MIKIGGDMKHKITEWFKKNYTDLYELMEICTHTHSNGSLNPYHCEETLKIHTEMVLDLVPNDKNFIFAALLHDIGKIQVRYEKENGRVAFYDHENVSMFNSIDILKHASKEFDIDILLVLQLVAWHGTLWNKTPANERVKEFDACYGHQPELFKNLIIFTEADAYGRIFAPEKESEIDFLDSQFQFLKNYTPYNKQAFRQKQNLDAIFLIGVSGSGKSTYIEKNFDLTNFDLISVDKFFYSKKMGYDSVDYKKNIKKAHDQSIADLLNAVKNKRNIIVDMTNLTKEQRLTKLTKIPTTQYNHKAVVFLIGEKQLNKNLAKRDHKKLKHGIILKQIESFELPNYDEFDEIKYVFDNQS